MAKVILGTQMKLLVNIQPVDGVKMQDMDFSILLSCGNKSLTFEKKDCKPENNGLDGYRVPFDTTDLGVGRVKVRVFANLTDGDFIGGKRKEITDLDTGIDIVRGL